MRCLGVFEDTVDPEQPILTLRKTARVFVINPQGKVGMIHVKGEDEFGRRDHLESCGGGIERGESLPRNLTAMEQAMMADPVWLSPQEIHQRLDPKNNLGIALLIGQRDFCAWQELLRRKIIVFN